MSRKRRKYSSIPIYTFFILPSINAIEPSLLLIKQPQTITDMPFCFRFGCKAFRVYFSFFVWRWKTHETERSLSHSTKHSSIKNTHRHSSTVQCRCALIHLHRSYACTFVNKGHFTALHFRIPASRRYCQIIYSLMSILSIFLSHLRGTCVSDSALWTSQWPLFQRFSWVYQGEEDSR